MEDCFPKQPNRTAEIEALTGKRDEQLKAASLLLDSGLASMVSSHLTEAFLATARIASIRSFSTPPESLEEVDHEPHRSHLPKALHLWLPRLKSLTPSADPAISRDLLAALRATTLLDG